MKKLSIITAFIAILFCCMGTTMAQNDNSNPGITKFVGQYFPKANVLMVNTEWDEYEVTLSDGTQIEFTRSPEWKESTVSIPLFIQMCPQNSSPSPSPTT